jgi:hypothetical protein
MRIKPNCKICKRPYLVGQDGYCEICGGAISPRKRKKQLHCLCGGQVYRIVVGRVFSAENEPMDIEVPLCEECLELELELEAEEVCPPSRVVNNPINIIVVHSLPRAIRRLKGRRL